MASINYLAFTRSSSCTRSAIDLFLGFSRSSSGAAPQRRPPRRCQGLSWSSPGQRGHLPLLGQPSRPWQAHWRPWSCIWKSPPSCEETWACGSSASRLSGSSPDRWETVGWCGHLMWPPPTASGQRAPEFSHQWRKTTLWSIKPCNFTWILSKGWFGSFFILVQIGAELRVIALLWRRPDST